MTTQLKSRVLTNGKSVWRITRFSDELFIATGSYGKKHTFRCDAEVINFEEFLFSKGFALRESGLTAYPLKRVEAVA